MRARMQVCVCTRERAHVATVVAKRFAFPNNIEDEALYKSYELLLLVIFFFGQRLRVCMSTRETVRTTRTRTQSLTNLPPKTCFKVGHWSPTPKRRHSSPAPTSDTKTRQPRPTLNSDTDVRHPSQTLKPVSYTHLTLPTKLSV